MLLINRTLLRMAKGLWGWILVITALKLGTLMGTAEFAQILSGFLGNIASPSLSLTDAHEAILAAFFTAVSVLLCSLLMALCCFVCCCVWALGGSALVGVYKKHTRPVNAVMALALVWCASELIVELIRGLAR